MTELFTVIATDKTGILGGALFLGLSFGSLLAYTIYRAIGEIRQNRRDSK